MLYARFEVFTAVKIELGVFWVHATWNATITKVLYI
jgi:hypothetical protein